MADGMLIFDAETAPLPDDVLVERIKPYKPPPPPGVFDPSAVKLGNMKDQAKIQEKIDVARRKHAAEVAEHNNAVAEGRATWLNDARDKAALSPVTGQLLAIGYLSINTHASVLDYITPVCTEAGLLQRFWKQYTKCRNSGRIMVGHNIIGFDIPFFVGRSWLLGIDVPETVFERGRYIDSRTFVDTMLRFACGSRNWTGLGTLAEAMGVGGKPDGVDGSMFGELFKTDQQAALAYLQNDLDMTARVAERMGLL